MQETSGYNLELYEGTDKTAWLGAFNGNMRKIDNALTEQYADTVNTNADTHTAINSMRDDNKNFKRDITLRQQGFEHNLEVKLEEHRQQTNERTQTAIEIGQGNTNEIARIKAEDHVAFDQRIKQSDAMITATRLALQDEIAQHEPRLEKLENVSLHLAQAHTTSITTKVMGRIARIGNIAIGTMTCVIAVNPQYGVFTSSTGVSLQNSLYVQGNPFGLNAVAVTRWNERIPDMPLNITGYPADVGSIRWEGNYKGFPVKLFAYYEASFDRTWLCRDIYNLPDDQTSTTSTVPDSCIINVCYMIS